ncbi:TonB-dependent receptor [Robertkochia flava]|uniref:TonB-dependent receptor n=1 Tax=Robertkochia flava TaxID=3447986 RepID=UPI001CCD8257|nr:TonB-dependent receptor [Robertkochia marina]
MKKIIKNIAANPMRFSHKLLFSGSLLFFSYAGTYAQEKEGVGTEVVNVVKAFDPTVNKAVKIQKLPVLEDSVTTTKKKVEYTIFSVPVASTFTPAKGKATVLKKEPGEELFNSYVALALGNYTAADLDAYTSFTISRDQRFDLAVNHTSSQGGLDAVNLDDRYFNSRIDAGYRMKDNYMDWGVMGGFQHQVYNWYGIPDIFSETEINQIAERQSYLTAELGGDIGFERSFFKKGEFQVRRFSDRFSSGENRALLKAAMELPISTERVTLDFGVDYLNGSFERNYANTDDLAYSNLMTHLSPGLEILSDDLTVNLGAALYYNFDIQNADHDFFLYPRVSASYRLIEEYIIPYGGLEGELIQTNYHDLVGENPFLSPTQNIQPTDMQYNAYVGVKGRLLPNLGYNLKGGYKASNAMPLFRSNPEQAGQLTQGYEYGNSFGVVYDDVKTLTVAAELNLDVNSDFHLGLRGEVMDYNTQDEAEAWNLPSLTGTLTMDYKLGEKWLAGANVFFVGDRKDLIDNRTLLDPEVVTIDSYFDINARLSYQVSKPLAAFVRLNNISNNEYARWNNFPVQGFQVLAGASYKFDL